MNYTEFNEKITELYKDIEQKTKEVRVTPFDMHATCGEEERAMLRHTGGCLLNPQDLKFCTFNMGNDTVKWTGYLGSAPEAIRLAYTKYAYDIIKNLNYGLYNMIGTSSENFARQKYNMRIEQGGPQFGEIVSGLMI